MAKKTVILFYPDTGEGSARILPPLPIMALDSYLQLKGYNPVLIDARCEPDAYDRLKNLLPEAVCLGVSSMTGPMISSGLKASQIAKEFRPDFPVVWGGWHPSILPEQTCSNQYVDIVVVGQGEITFLEVIERLNEGKNMEGVLGVVYKDNGKIIRNDPRPLVQLDEFPPLPFHRIDMKKYPGRASTDKDIFTTYRTSQGCPFRCAFCADPLVFHRKFVTLSPKRIISELKDLQDKYGVTEILFVDDTFFMNDKRIREFCELYIKEGLKIRWQGCARVGTIAKMDPEVLDLIKKSNCDLIHPGVEAPTQQMLDYILKDEKLENTFICAEKLSKHGIRALYSFIVCYPGEPPDTIAETFRVVRKLKEIDNNNIMPINFYTPYPGNVLYDRAVAMGFKPPETLEEWADFNTRIGNVPWITDVKRDEVMKKDKYYLPAAYPSRDMLRRMESGFWKYLYRAFHAIAKYRVEHDWYSFDIDWWLLLKYWRFWGKYNRKFKLHNIFFR